MFAPGATAEQRELAREDLEVLACLLTCALNLARRLHNAGVLIDLAPIQEARDRVENALIDGGRGPPDPLSTLVDPDS